MDNPEDVVISGISGVFPLSENVEEFKENLLTGKDMISTSIRPSSTGQKIGLLKTIEGFDNSFFRISDSQAQIMNYASKMLLEKTFEAILDAGYNPREIKGKNIAVIGGIWEISDLGDPSTDRKPNSYDETIGKMKFMLPNRISNWLDVHGPSYSINTACSSSLYAFDHAIKAIQRGQCEGAIVCSANFCLQMLDKKENTPFLSSKGESAPFDADADGYVRAEAAAAVFLQKRKNARRIYAKIIHSTTNSDGFKDEGFAFPSVKQQIKLYEQFYQEINMDPRLISYIETHGTSTRAGDFVEGTSIEDFFCANRNTPLKIGTVKSNMGHSEPAAGLCSVIKLIIAFESGTIPANLRYNKPNPNIKGLFNGKLEVISKPAPLEGEYFAVNAFGMGGSNGHLVISPSTKIKTETNFSDVKIPWLVTASGRTEEAVDCILKYVEENSKDAEYIRLLHEIFKYDINGHLYRGYAILQKDKDAKTSKNYFSGEKRPIWFVFTGMGSQWPGMGKSLMGISIFAESIRKSHQVLVSKGLDLINIITDDNPQMFEKVLNSFVGIVAIEIALVDVLRKLNIKPEGMIGHSLGELACAYADGCLTAEQTILAAYYRGFVTTECSFVRGTMVAVGESYHFMKDLVPPEIDIACHNGPTSCTLSGPSDAMQNFVNELNEKKIFVRTVNTANIAYHSRYFAAARPKLMNYLKQVISEPKLRSEKWICTSAPEHEWNTDEVKYSSAEYHTNNSLNPVYFEESYRFIPDNAITIEIAPHGLLNAILKRSLPSTVDNIPLTLRNHENSTEYLLNALGRIYELGCEMELYHLYPPIEFPVSKSTPMISPLIKWNHDDQQEFDEIHANTSKSRERTFKINPKSKEYAYIEGHVINGRNLYPGFGYLWHVVETIASIENKSVTDISIMFENVNFERAVTTPKKGGFNFHISVQKYSNSFEVNCNGEVVTTGKVRIIENSDKEMVDVRSLETQISNTDQNLPLDSKNFYKELRLRGYHYKGLFRNVQYVNSEGTYAEISWCNNFVTFMDTMAQIFLLDVDCRDPVIPTFIGKIVIDFGKHFKILESLDKENPKFALNYYPYHNLLHSGGIQICGWKGMEINRQKTSANLILEKYQFVPYISDEQMDLNNTIRICVQIAMKNTNVIKATTYELLDEKYDEDAANISTIIFETLNDTPLVEADINVLTKSTELIPETSEEITISNEELPKNKTAWMIILTHIQNKINIIDSILNTLKPDGFIITKEFISENIQFETLGLNVCFSRIINNTEKIILLNRLTDYKPVKQEIQIKNTSFSWIPEVQNALNTLDQQAEENLVVFAEKESTNGILGFFNCLRKEEKGMNVRCFFIMDENAPNFTLDDAFYESQYRKNLSHNVYKNGKWGSYWHLALDKDTTVASTHAICGLDERGDLSSFKLIEGWLDPSKRKYTNGASLVQVYYSGINFKDVMLAVGRLSIMDTPLYSRLSKSYFGFEFSGKEENGKRVMGIVHNGGIATMLESLLTWKVPNSMTLEEASTIPIVYTTVVYALFFKMNLKEGSSVLIHSGSGGVGQAAIHICTHYKCNIFTTVGTPEKREFIRKTFPHISETHIGNSRDLSFKNMIMEQTKGRGVDVVLNSLPEDKLRASLRCIARYGHFIEIGKLDIIKNNPLEMGHFENDISFHSVQVDVLLLEIYNESRFGVFYDKMQNLIDQGIVKPIHRTVFQMNEIESAFRYMASGKHTGKLVIKFRDEEDDINAKPTLMRLNTKPQFYCQENKTYVVVGGLGGFGMELVDWLTLRGARNIVLSSRNGIKNGYQSHRIKLCRSYGVRIEISTSDITKATGVENLLRTANSLAPVAGIFNLAMILEDGQFSEQTEDKFNVVADPKAIATAHLDQLSRKLCPYLEHFVVFSSVASGQGNADQTNYGFANSVMERICESRKADNLPALAIQWGAIAEVGIISDSVENDSSIVLKGWVQQKLKSCLGTLDLLLKQQNPIVCSKMVAKKRKTDSDIISTVANLLGIKDPKTISLTWTLSELGMDSILGLEMKQILEAELQITLTPEELRTMTFGKLYRLKEEKENTPNQANKVQTQMQFFMNENARNQMIIRIPFTEGKIQEQLPINENPTVFVFPGVEGLAITMEPLANNLPIQTLCFQYYFIKEYSTFEKLGQYFSLYILENLLPEQEFCLIGHSVGAAIVIEVAEILENQGRKGRIWLIDGSPETVQVSAAKKFQKNAALTDESLQNQVCDKILSILIPGLHKEGHFEHVENAPDWESKKKISLNMLSRITKNDKFPEQLFDTMLNINKAAMYYKKLSNFSLQSPCVLIRCVEDYSDLPLDESYGLTKHFKNPIEIYKIQGVDHFSILLHPKTAEIIIKSLPWKKN